MRHGSYELDVTHTLTANLLSGYVNAALLALVDLSAVRILILSAHTSAVLGRTKDTLAEETADLCLKSSIVYSLRLFNLAVRPFSDHIRRCTELKAWRPWALDLLAAYVSGNSKACTKKLAAKYHVSEQVIRKYKRQFKKFIKKFFAGVSF